MRRDSGKLLRVLCNTCYKSLFLDVKLMPLFEHSTSLLGAHDLEALASCGGKAEGETIVGRTCRLYYQEILME